MTDLKNLGMALKALREEKRCTLRDIAHISGLSISTISDIENAERDPSFATLTRLCSALGIRLGQLLDKTDNMTSQLKAINKQQQTVQRQKEKLSDLHKRLADKVLDLKPREIDA